MKALLLAALFVISLGAQFVVPAAFNEGAPNTPTDSPGMGTYSSSQSVTLSDPHSLTILYTTTGTPPTCPSTGTVYSGAFNITVTTTLKAIGCNGVTGGGVLTSVYTINSCPAYSVCSHVSAGSTDNKTVTTPAIDTTHATLFILSETFTNFPNFGTSCSTPTDSTGANTWHQLTGGPFFPASISYLTQWYVFSPTTSATQTFTQTCSVNRGPAIELTAVSGTYTGVVESTIPNAGTGAATSKATGSTGTLSAANAEACVTTANFNALNSAPSMNDGFNTIAGAWSTPYDFLGWVTNQHFGIATGVLFPTATTALNVTVSWTTSIAATVMLACYY